MIYEYILYAYQIMVYITGNARLLAFIRKELCFLTWLRESTVLNASDHVLWQYLSILVWRFSSVHQCKCVKFVHPSNLGGRKIDRYTCFKVSRGLIGAVECASCANKNFFVAFYGNCRSVKWKKISVGVKVELANNVSFYFLLYSAFEYQIRDRIRVVCMWTIL